MNARSAGFRSRLATSAFKPWVFLGVNRDVAGSAKMNLMKVSDVRIEVLAGLTAALSFVPEIVGFALVAHVNPLTGLYTAFIICLVASIWGGRRGMISGAAGSMAVVSAGLVVQHGIEYLFATIVLTGILQMLFAWFRLGKLIRMVPHVDTSLCRPRNSKSDLRLFGINQEG